MDLPSDWCRLPHPFTRYAADKAGNVYNITGLRPHIMTPRPKRKPKPGRHGDPRPMLTLSSDVPGPGGKPDRETQQVGYWVLFAWRSGRPKAGYETSHLNGICTDNRLDNLEWETSKKNRARKYASGMSSGIFNPNSFFKNKDSILEIQEAYYDLEQSVSDIANDWGASERTIYRILSGDTYAAQTALNESE